MGSARRDRSILLTGMMGTGKTSVGRLLGRRLGWRFIDTDERVEAHAAVPVRTIFERDGEARFRELERAVLEELPTRRAVIALGGGAVVAAENRTLLRDKGTLVWLDADPEVLAARLPADDERPLLAGLEGAARVERLRQLRNERLAAYRSAELRVATDDRTPEAVCAAVLCALGREDAA